MQSTLIASLPASLVLIGLMIQVATLAPLRKMIAIIPAGPLRTKWLALTGLIFIFIAGYVGYIAVLWGATGRVVRPPHSRHISFGRNIGAANDWAFATNHA